MSGYTQGPWFSKGHGVIVGGPFRWFTNGQSQSQIALVCLMTEGATDDPSAEREANALLIAAAPALVEALKPFARLLADHHERLSDDTPVYGVMENAFTIGDIRRAAAALRAAGVEP